jgi:hypothetical protein
MKQLVATLAVLIAVVAGISWATSRSSSAQEQEPPVETPAPDEDSPAPLEDLRNSLDEFAECLRDQGIEVPDSDQGEGRFGFHFEFDSEDLEALAEAHEACGDALPFGEFAHPFGGRSFDPDGFSFGDDFPFGDNFPFGGRLGGGLFGFGGALDVDELAECLSELGTFEDVDDVKAQLEQCLPAREDFQPPSGDFESWLEGFDGEEFSFGGRHGFGFFDGPWRFGFDFDFDGELDLKDPDGEGSTFEGAVA